MHKTARQRHVLDILSEQGQASITELAEKLQVSADTIRRDLTDLENQGLAQKNHGGAIALNLSAMNRQGRNTLLPETKQRLGKQVALQVPAGSTLFLDAGSTVDIAILGACAIHAELGLSAGKEADAEVKRAMLDASHAHWIVADHLKVNRCEPYLVSGLSNIQQLFLDRPWPELGDPGALQVTVCAN